MHSNKCLNSFRQPLRQLKQRHIRCELDFEKFVFPCKRFLNDVQSFLEVMLNQAFSRRCNDVARRSYISQCTVFCRHRVVLADLGNLLQVIENRFRHLVEHKFA